MTKRIRNTKPVVKLVSLSKHDALQSFLKCLYVLIMDVNKNNVDAFLPEFKRWFSESSPFLRKLGILADVTKIVNLFVLKKKFTHDDAVELGKLLSTQKKTLDADLSIDSAELQLFNACVSNLARNSESSWAKLFKGISLLAEPSLIAEWIEEEEPLHEISGVSATTALKNVHSCVTVFNGSTSKIWLSPQDLAAFRASDMATFKVYSQNVKVLNQIVKKAIFAFVRKSGKDKVTIDALRAYLDQNKIVNNVVRGMSGGLIDENGVVYTREGFQLQRIPVGPVRMNPLYKPDADSTYVCTELEPPCTRHSTVQKVMKNKGNKFSAVQEFLKNESAHRARWVTDLKKDGTKEQIMACMVELLWATSSRIGEKGNATAGKETFGLSTLNPSHIVVSTNQIQLKFAGKKAYDKAGNTVNEQNFIYKVNDVTSKKVQAIVKQLMQGKAKSATVFEFNGSPMIRQYIGKYLKSIGVALSSHGFRHINGTRIALAELAQCPYKKGQATQAQVEKWVKDALKKVGNALHHRNGTNVTAMTAITSYIDPGLLVDFFEGQGLRVPKWVPVKARSAK